MTASLLKSSYPGVLLAVLSVLTIARAEDGGQASTRVNTWSPTHPYIIQSRSTFEAAKGVTQVGAKVRQDLPIIHGVVADLSARQAAQIRSHPDAHDFADRAVGPRGAAPPPPPTNTLAYWLSLVFSDGAAVTGHANQFVTNFPILGGADTVQARGITGKGVTIAILDTGIWTGGGDDFQGRILGSYDVLTGGKVSSDPFGHGTLVASIAAGKAVTKFGTSFGIAPDANLVIVRAGGARGAGGGAGGGAGRGG